jgi:signal transduction histidine kinase
MMNKEINDSPESRGQDGFITGNNEMAALIRSLDWSATALGPIDTWPQSLRTTVSLCLASNFPINIIWGPEHTQIYNDGYAVVCGEKHPAALGMDYTQCWASAWPAIGQPFEQASQGATSFLENQRMFLNRNGYLEETFFTFSLSPIQDESGHIGGLFHPVTETTATMLSERRNRGLRDLTARLTEASRIAEVFSMTIATLAAFDLDLPCVLLYELDRENQCYRLAESTGIAPGTPISRTVLALDASDAWPVPAAISQHRAVQVDGIRARLGEQPCGPYDEAPDTALVLPIEQPGLPLPVALLIAAISPRLPFDDVYRGFFDLLAAALRGALTRVAAVEAERRRTELVAALDHAKTLFFSNVSHEFRTPLTLILGPLEEALTEPQLSAAQQERLEIANRNANRLLKLVNSLLDLSRIEAGRAEARFEPTDLSALTEDLASSFRSACKSAGIDLLVSCAPLRAAVRVDHAMWEKIVLNLVSNAFKYTLEGSIGVQLRESGDAVELLVADTGVGIPGADLERIFDRFHRVEGQAGRPVEGSGIGLALVRELVHLHEGTVSARSVQGQGSVFTVTIPYGRVRIAPDRRANPQYAMPGDGGRIADSYVSEALHWLPDSTPEPVTTDRPEAAPGALAARIVLADDNADMRGYIQRMLEAAGYLVIPVNNGKAALAAIHAGPLPDLVISDVMMPEMDGFELLAALRSAPLTSGIFVMLLSARAGEEARLEGLAAGADDYMVKPFGARELRARIDGAIKLARLRREAAAREQALHVQIEIERGRVKLRESEAAANTRKDEFLAMLAHELRNPLAPIGAAAELMANMPLDEARLKRTGLVITRQVRHMTGLIDDLLDVSRVTRGLVDISRTVQEVSSVALNAVEQALPLIEAHGHQLVTDLANEPGRILGDHMRLVQVVTNLLNNAAKYTPDGGTIHLSTAVAGPDITITVMDTGIGIAQEVQPRVFDLFSQAERTPDRSQGGLGLGLALVKNLVELHGGRVGCFSAGLGQGSTFTVVLPRMPENNEVDLPQDVEAGARPGFGKLKVLVVDDNLDAAQMMQLLFEASGHSVSLAHDALSALDLAATIAPDACILDIGLPGLDGNEPARRLHARRETAGSTLIALTGYGQQSDIDAAYAAGFDHHIVKPANIERLNKILAGIGAGRSVNLA